MLLTAVAMSALVLGVPSAAVTLETLEVESSRHVRVSWSMPQSHIFARLVAVPESPSSPIVAHDFHGLFGGGGGYGWDRKHIQVEDSARVLRTPLPLAPGRYKFRLAAAPASARDHPLPTVVWSNIAEVVVADTPKTAPAVGRDKNPPDGAASLPPGIKALRIGHARRTRGGKGDECSVEPVEGNAFASGTAEVTFAAELEGGAVRSLEYKITGPGPTLDRGVGCSAYAVCAGQVCQTQYGWSNRRSDGRPLASGTYKLTLVVDGHTVERGFSVR